MSKVAPPALAKNLAFSTGSTATGTAFLAVGVGSTTLSLMVAATCSPGTVCPLYIASRVPLAVTVRA
jgi:hypothetical protein